MKTNKDYFINEKQSKLKHFSQNNPGEKDIIFVGSSKTFFEISTNTFKENNIDIYNLGIQGAQFEDYPTLIQGVIKYKPRKIVISLSMNRFYDKLSISKFPTFEEIKIYYEIDKVKFLKSLYTWAINKHTLLTYSEVIFFKIKSFYNRFQPKIGHVNSINNKSQIQNFNYSKLVECNVFDVKNMNSKFTILKCSNGDGVLIGNNIKEVNQKEINLNNINKESIEYLSIIIRKLKAKGTEVFLVLEPIFHNPYRYNLSDIERKFEGVHIIDLTNYSLDDSMWADNGHLNYLGKEKYSLCLTKVLNISKN